MHVNLMKMLSFHTDIFNKKMIKKPNNIYKDLYIFIFGSKNLYIFIFGSNLLENKRWPIFYIFYRVSKIRTLIMFIT